MIESEIKFTRGDSEQRKADSQSLDRNLICRGAMGGSGHRGYGKGGAMITTACRRDMHRTRGQHRGLLRCATNDIHCHCEACPKAPRGASAPQTWLSFHTEWQSRAMDVAAMTGCYCGVENAQVSNRGSELPAMNHRGAYVSRSRPTGHTHESP